MADPPLSFQLRFPRLNSHPGLLVHASVRPTDISLTLSVARLLFRVYRATKSIDLLEHLHHLPVSNMRPQLKPCLPPCTSSLLAFLFAASMLRCLSHPHRGLLEFQSQCVEDSNRANNLSLPHSISARSVLEHRELRCPHDCAKSAVRYFLPSCGFMSQSLEPIIIIVNSSHSSHTHRLTVDKEVQSSLNHGIRNEPSSWYSKRDN